MIRRTVHGLAALVVVALLIVVPGTPASADPIKPLCTVQEWQNPKNFFDCSQRLGNAASRRADCLHAPTPDSPDSGVAGWLTSRPDSDLRSGITGLYSQHGVAGYPLELYDVTCAGGISHPEAGFENAIASMEFAAAANTIGAANGLRERAYDPGSMWGWSDSFVREATEKTYKYVFSVFGALTLAGVGGWLIWRARQGNLSETVKITGWALLVMVAVTGIAKYPLQSAHAADKAAVTGLGTLHAVLGPGPADLPPEKCHAFEFSPEACKDHRTVAVRSSDAAVEAILYRNWLRAVLGCDSCAVATKYGPALYDATTFTWGESQKLDANPALRTVMLQQKANQWMSVAEAVKAEDPEAYEHLQGLHGTDRVGTGFVAMISAFIYAIFDVAASIVILLGFLVVRVSIVLLPLLATIGILQPANGGVLRLANATLGSLINIVVFGGGAGLYLWIVDGIFASGLPGAIQVVAIGLTGIVLWMLLRPIKRLARIGARKKDEDTKPGLLHRIFTFANDTAREARQPANPPARPMPGRPRPETTAGSRA
jgi:hypothetical protein